MMDINGKTGVATGTMNGVTTGQGPPKEIRQENDAAGAHWLNDYKQRQQNRSVRVAQSKSKRRREDE